MGEALLGGAAQVPGEAEADAPDPGALPALK